MEKYLPQKPQSPKRIEILNFNTSTGHEIRIFTYDNLAFYLAVDNSFTQISKSDAERLAQTLLELWK